MTSKIDASPVTITYQYDALNRLTTIDFPTDVDIVYSYDTCVNGKSKLCTMTDASGSTSYEYYAKGQMKTETKVIGGVTYTTQYTYDMNGNIKTMTYPSGRVVTYNYTNDRVVSVLNNAAYLATSIGYKPFGGMTSITYGNDIAGSIDYDNQYRITSLAAGAVLSLNYSLYDANGNIKTIQNGLESTKSRSFTYDALDRLDTAISSGIWGGTLDWDYDGVGNRVKEIDGSQTTNYNYSAGTNKLQSMTGALGKTFTFDLNGNTDTEDGSRDFVYDQNQRLIRVVDGSTTKGEYTFNGNGQRVKKVASGATTIFHYNQSGQIIAESETSGNISVEYVYLNGQPLGKIEGSNVYYYHNDHLGTPQKLTDSTGTVVWSADYKPFGEATITVSTITNNLRFPGQYFDQETGLNYNYYRDYNPVIGRYIQADPIGLQGGLNLFGYGQNNPIIKMDFWGLEANGCGPADWRSALVPDSPFFIINFKSACDTHDNCYGKCGANKATCDSEFRTNMKVLCFYKYNLDIVTDVPTLPNPMLHSCYGFAQLYYNAVSKQGQSAYDAAQKDCPQCKKK
jgi:RHS repeat-associated protein